jgi:hypothetical protein
VPKGEVALNGCGPLGDGLRHCEARYGCVQRKPVLSEVEGTIDETSSATAKRKTDDI